MLLVTVFFYILIGLLSFVSCSTSCVLFIGFVVLVVCFVCAVGSV